jgi:hypothetical protein
MMRGPDALDADPDGFPRARPARGRYGLGDLIMGITDAMLARSQAPVGRVLNIRRRP